MGICRYVARFGNGSNIPVSNERMERALRMHERYLEMLGCLPDATQDRYVTQDKYVHEDDKPRVGLMREGEFQTGE